MKYKTVLIGLISVFSICLIAAVSFLLPIQSGNGKKLATNQFTDILEQSRKNDQETFLEILTRYGYQELQQEIENNNVNVIKVVVNGVSAKDYYSLLNMTKENGNASLARTMEAVRQNISTQIFDEDDGEESCH
jgi:hypothetical protein